ncbi:MAG TPA: hypothetical protein PKD64_19725 [Pirellulaceae bacterium]|nr:hypothetical protein [Pirellulaceae bacterium]HMO94421.1 hypothetical protein [Pirellulaceae bacterium]
MSQLFIICLIILALSVGVDLRVGYASQQESTGEVSEVPKKDGHSLMRLGIACSTWRDLVWNFKRYFDRSS